MWAVTAGADRPAPAALIKLIFVTARPWPFMALFTSFMLLFRLGLCRNSPVRR